MRNVANSKWRVWRKVLILLIITLSFVAASVALTQHQVSFAAIADYVAEEMLEPTPAGEGEPVVYALGGLPDTLQEKQSVPQFFPDDISVYSEEVIDYTDVFPNPGDQGSQGSCTAWAVGYAAKSYLVNIGKKWDVKNHTFSPSYIYNQLNGGKDNGIDISDAMELVVNQGICLLSDMPYNDKDYTTQPTQNQKNTAMQYRSLRMGWLESGNVNAIKATLYSKLPVVISIPVYPDFDNIKKSNPIYDTVSDDSRGRHVICLIGYDDTQSAFKFINSWGTSWGLGGYGYISYSLIKQFDTTGWVLYDAAFGQFANSQFSGTTLTKYNPIDNLQASVTIPYGITDIGNSAFVDQTEITDITLADTVLTIGDNAFENCENLKEIFGLDNVQIIGKKAFNGCSELLRFAIPTDTVFIGDGAFAGCVKLHFSTSGNMDYIVDNNIVYNNRKTEILHTGKIASNITVDESVTRIASHAFDGNSNLRKITFKNSLEIWDEAFANIWCLDALIFDSDTPPLAVGADVLANCLNAWLVVPYDVQDLYRAVFNGYRKILSPKVDVTFDGGEVRNETKAYYYGQTVTLPVWDDIPGYYFYGWTDENGVACSSPYRFMTKNAVMLHAEISPITYNVTLDSNGGELMGDNTFYATFGEECFTNTTARRKNYKLSGWADRDGNLLLDASGKSAAKWNIADDVTLYAVWEIESYEIMISDGGKYIWLDNALMLSDDNIEYGDVFVLDELAEQYALSYQGFKEGHIFTEFQLADSDLTDMPDIGESGTRRVIKPIWRKEQYRLTFNKNTYADVGDVGDIVAEFDEEITLHQPFRVGYTFMGWEDLNKSLFEYEKMPDLSPTAQEDVVLQLRARWEANTYYIFYDANGGNGGRGMDVMTELKYDNYGHLAKHTYYLEGHVFAGWARSRYGAVEYSDYDYVTNLTAEPNGRIMLYAIWRPATYRVICKNLAQGWTTSNVNFTYGVGMNTMPVIYTCNIGGRYYTLETFEGWYTSTKFQTQVTSISPWQTTDVTVYAKYTYSVVNEFDGDTYTVTDGKLENQPYFEVNFRLSSYHFTKIKDTTLKSIRIDVSLNIWEVDDGYQDCYLFCGDTQIWKQTIEHGKGKKNGAPAPYTLDIPLFAIENYASQDYFTLRFGAHGAFSDTWKFNDLEMHISFVNDAPTA